MKKSRIGRWSWSRMAPEIGGAFWLAALPVLGAEATVSIVDFAFNPPLVSIHVSDSVIWTWVGPTPHTSTSDTGLWDSGFMSATASQFTNSFKLAGSFPYHCTLHPFMTASVTVSPVGPSGADVAISLTGAPNPVLVSNQLTYTLVINNAGPGDAPDVVVTDSLPASVSFISASTSQGSATQSAAGWRWDAGPLAKGASATGTVTVLPLAQGTITNTGFVSINDSTVTDPVPANNTASAITSVNGAGSTNMSIQIQLLGGIVFDPQTGLFEQSLRLSNPGSNSIAAVRLVVLDLPPDVALYNASGATNGAPFVEYDQPLGSGGSIDFLLEYYRSNRLDLVSTNFETTVVAPATPAPPTGASLELDRDPFRFNGGLVIEFASIPGRTYIVQYSADMQTWSTAVPPLIAAGTRVQWIDAGPPKTDSAPGAPGQRFYRIAQLP
jgi:uncharacterized repeat protein (TIGR01451 family)